MRLWLLAFLFLIPFNLPAEEDLSRLNPMKARGFFLDVQLLPGMLADFQIEMDLQEDFFAYQERFRLDIEKPGKAQAGELSIHPIVEFEDTFSKKKKKGIRGKATLTTQIQIPENISADLKTFKFFLTYIACTKKFCLTPRTLAIPVDVSGKIVIPANVEPGEEGNLTASIEKQIDDNLAYALLLIFFFGLLTSLTPCVYPLIPITLAVLGTDEKRSKLKSFLISLSYVLGIGITYALLGVIAAQTGQLFGSLISHPIVIVVMSLIFFAMGLSLLGLFEIQPPAFIRDKMANTKTDKGFVGAFVSGLLAGIIASPCVGPVLVGVLAYIAKSQNSSLGFILLFTFAMGFGTLFIVLGTFSQMANKLPRSGAWMNIVKTILAFSMFALSFYYAWPLLKKVVPESVISQSQSKVKWEPFSPEKVVQAKKDGLPVIIDFYADWCAACVEMDKLTFVKDNVIDASKKFVMLKVDATSPFDELTEWQQTYKVYGLPTMIFIDSKGVVRTDLTLTGFEEAPLFAERMAKALN